MHYTIDVNSREPAYLQLYRRLRDDIVCGAYRYGERLPSKRLLAAELGISVVTAQHALAILCDEGYAGTRERSGCFVTYKAGDGFAASPLPAVRQRRLIPHEKTENTIPFSVLSRTMRRVMSEYGDALLLRSPNRGLLPLRQALAAYLARSRGMHVQAEQIVIGSGAEYLYGLTVQMLGRERVFGVEDPCYEKIRAVFGANGVCYEALQMGEDGITTAALQQSKASVLHVTPYHSYPSGVSASASKRRAYIDFAKARDGYIIEDDFDSEFTVSAKMEDTLFSLDSTERVIYLNTFTKTVAPSLRVGYMVLPPSLLSLFEAQVGFYACTVPLFEQYVLAELLDSGDFERHINRRRREKRRELTGRS